MPVSLGRLHRIPDRGVIAGVCAGIAEYFDWNVRLLRAILVIAFVVSGFFPIVVAYCVLWYVMEPVRPGTAAFAEPVGSAGPGLSERPASTTELKARFARLEERLGHMEECVTTREFELRRELRKLET